MEDVPVVGVMRIPERVTEPQGIVQSIVRIIPLVLTAIFVNHSSLGTQRHKIVKVTTKYY